MYGLFPPVMEIVRACLPSADVYALHVVKRGCTRHVSTSCIDEGTVRKLVLGTVVVQTSWEEEVYQVLPNWHSCSNTINGPRRLVLDEVGPFSAVLGERVAAGIPLVVPERDLVCLHNLIRGVSYSNFFGVEPYGVVDYLRIRLKSGRNAKVLEKFPGWNAVSGKSDVLTAW